jgi:hypothetical protein
MELGGVTTDRMKADLVDSIATSIGTSYFDALGLKITAGRDFTESEVFAATPSHVAIIDDVLATRLFGTSNPVGQQVQYRGRQDGDAPVVLDVVGVAPGLRHSLFDKTTVAHIYTPLSQDFRSDVFFHVKTAAGTPEAEAAMLPQLRQALRDVDPTLPILRTETRAQYADRNFTLAIVRLGAGIFGLFGAVALVLASIGVYGVKAYIVSRRTREIGIRMALGATPGSVVGLVIKEGIALSAVGLTIGVGLSALAAVGLRSLLFQSSPFDPVATIAALLVLTLSAFVASWIPARRATVVPVTAQKLTRQLGSWAVGQLGSWAVSSWAVGRPIASPPNYFARVAGGSPSPKRYFVPVMAPSASKFEIDDGFAVVEVEDAEQVRAAGGDVGDGHSDRSATVGEIFVARRAGKKPAMIATTVSSTKARM